VIGRAFSPCIVEGEVEGRPLVARCPTVVWGAPLALWSLNSDNKGQRPDLYQLGATPQVKCARRGK